MPLLRDKQIISAGTGLLRQMRLAGLILGVLMVVAGYFGLVMYYSRANAQSEVQVRYIDRFNEVPMPVYIPQVKVVEVPMPYEVPVPVERVITKEVKVQVPVEVPVIPQDFESLDELKEFLEMAREEFTPHLLPGRDGVTQFKNQCVAYARTLRDLAARYGKSISIEIVSPAEYERWFGRHIKNEHALNLAIVGKTEMYWIEPSTWEIRHRYYIP